MRQTAPILHAAEQQRLAILQADGRRIEDAIDAVRPVAPAEDGIG